jgi:hypothetical protein
MADTKITLTFSEAQVAELSPALREAVSRMSRNQDVLDKVRPLLDAEGVGNMTELSLRKQAKLWIYSQLMFMRQKHDRAHAGRAAEDAATENAKATSPIEVS